jgi:hypothetical protein
MKPQPFVAPIACAGALLFLASTASAQSTGPYATTFSANFDVAYHETFFDNSNVGAHFDLAGTVKRDVPMVAVVGEAGFNHFSDATIATVVGGARVRIPIEDDRFQPFGEIMLGLYHCSVCNENDPALQAGGGVDFRMPRRRSFKLRAQLDFRHVFSGQGGFDAVRLSGGIVLPLSGR